MYFNKIKPYKFNSIARVPGSEYLEKDTLKKLYKAHQKDLDDLLVDEEMTLNEVTVVVIKHLIKKGVFDMFVTNQNYGYEDSNRIDPAFKIKAVPEFYKYAKIDLYAIYKERKNTELFEVLTFLLQQLLIFIPFPDFDNDFMGIEIIREELMYSDEGVTENYLAIKEYDLIMTPFENHIRNNKKTFSLRECLDIIPKDSYWHQFSKDVFEFLENPSHLTHYSYYFDIDEIGYDFQPLNNWYYWGFTWDSPGSYFQNVFIDWVDIHSRETFEFEPLLICNPEENFEDEYKKMKHMFNFLNKHNANKR